MRITIPLVVLVAVLVGPSAFAQSPSQDNSGQIPNNSGAGVPGLPGNKSGPAHRQSGMNSGRAYPRYEPGSEQRSRIARHKVGAYGAAS